MKCLIAVLCLGILLPAVVLSNIAGRGFISAVQEAPEETSAQTSPAAEPTKICVLQDDALAEMDIEDYLVGVLLCEMPTDFHPEALKAQAVVARTYTLRRCLEADKHESGAVCTNSDCCQGYRDPGEYPDEEGVKKAAEAVQATAGAVLMYGDDLIEATYFSCSGGMTEDAVAVWGEDVPYLQAKKSPGEEQASHFCDTVHYSLQEFQKRLQITPEGPAESWITDITYTQGGGVDTAKICGTVFTGVELRKRLNLRSTAMILTAIGDTVTVTTRGFGHRVGMSQYGAEAMAAEGNDYQQILTYYYDGA